MQGGPGQNPGEAELGLQPRKPQSLHTQWTNTDHTGAQLPCPCTDDPPQKVEVGDQLS